MADQRMRNGLKGQGKKENRVEKERRRKKKKEEEKIRISSFADKQKRRCANIEEKKQI